VQSCGPPPRDSPGESRGKESEGFLAELRTRRAPSPKPQRPAHATHRTQVKISTGHTHTHVNQTHRLAGPTRRGVVRYRRADREVPQVDRGSGGRVAQRFLCCGRLDEDLGESQERGLDAIQERCKLMKRVLKQFVVYAEVGLLLHFHDGLYGQSDGGKELSEVLCSRASPPLQLALAVLRARPCAVDAPDYERLAPGHRDRRIVSFDRRE